MGDVIRLPTRSERQQTSEPKPLPAEGATVLLFMGVRYERHGGDAAEPQKSSRKPRAKQRA